MPADAEMSALRRMVRPARPLTGSMTDARAWRMSVPRTSETAVGLVAAVDGFETESVDLTAILQNWDEATLSLGLSGPEGSRGLAVLDTQLLAALIEVQTVGRVTNRTVEARAGTAVDAALAGHVIDRWIAAYGAAMGAKNPGNWTHTRVISSARAAKMALDDGAYVVQVVTFSLGDGTRTGVLRLYLPEDGLTASAHGAAVAADTSRDRLLNVRADLRAVLCRTSVPLAWLRGAKPGSVLHVPRAALGQVVIETGEGKHVAKARLGRIGAHKALRMDPDEGDMSVAPADDWHDSGSGIAAVEQDGIMALPEPIGEAGILDLPGTPGDAGLPDLPEAEALPDLPELPDLPGLPEID